MPNRIPLPAAAAVALALAGIAGSAEACDLCRSGGTIGLPSIGGPAPVHAPRPASLGNMPVAPGYSSLPGAPVTLFLDLDGINYQGTWAGGTPGNVPAYDTDGDASTFSTEELASIRQIYTRVAEAFTPFNVNVTTVDPAVTFDQPRLAARVIIGGDNAWFGGGGGVAYVGGFAWEDVDYEWRTSWAFPANLGAGNPKYVSDATIHEAGHMFGLWHQSAFDANGNKTAEYRQSTDGGLTAPHMGVAYGAVRGLWSDGPRDDGGNPNPQYDLTVLETMEATPSDDEPWPGYWNGFGRRVDDWGDSLGSASPMTADAEMLTAEGVIETSTDVDVFTFTVTGGQVTIAAVGAEFGQMLDIVLELYGPGGDLIFSDNPALSLNADQGYGLDASFAGVLAAGDYFLAIESNGGYGDIGQFFVTASGAVLVPEPTTAGLLALGGLAMLRRRRA